MAESLLGKVVLMITTVAALSGCSSLMVSRKWPSPVLTAPAPVSTSLRLSPSPMVYLPSIADVECSYAAALQSMECDDERCVDEFFQTVLSAWSVIESGIESRGGEWRRAEEIYGSALNSLVFQGERFQRFHPQVGLHVRQGAESFLVPVQYHGFARPPEDFNALLGVGEYQTTELNRVYRRQGLGVPVMVRRIRPASADFLRKEGAFAATLVLRPNPEPQEVDQMPYALEFHDPTRIASIEVSGRQRPLARDTSAPIARTLNATERNYLQAFLQPGITDPDEEGLFMLQGYQPGKIPVIVVHGLLSDRLTWANFANEFFARPQCVENFQLWSFEYPTGEPFLQSAASLRRSLEQLLCRYDPEGSDPAARQAILIGHSMGGLISTMQVSESEGQLWHAIAKVPFESIQIDAQYRERMAQAFFFHPSPAVSRVILVGTPHGGSVMAQQWIGRVSSMLVKVPEPIERAHRQLIEANPNVFSDEFSRRMPTSIDLLEPSSPLLQAIRKLPMNGRVRVHSIIGNGHWMPGNGDSDGVVPVSSARHPAAVSEKFVRTKHSWLTQDPLVIDEILSILETHIAESELDNNR